MPIWLLANWRIFAIVLAVAAVLGWGSLGWWKYTGLRADYAQFKSDIAKVTADAVEKNRQTEAENARLSRNIEAAHADAAAAAAASRDDFARQLADGLRRARGAGCRSLPSEAAHPAVAPEGIAGNERGHRPDDSGSTEQPEVGQFLAIRDMVKSLQRSAAAGVAFAHVCGQ